MLIEALTARAGAWVAGKTAKLLIAGGVVLAIAFCLWRAAAALESALGSAYERGEQQERYRWQAEIASSNAKIAEAQLAADRAARAASDRAAGEIATLRKSLEDLERANAALPNPDSCGLDRGRVQLLRKQSGAGDPKR